MVELLMVEKLGLFTLYTWNIKKNIFEVWKRCQLLWKFPSSN